MDHLPFGLTRRPFRSTPDTDAYCPLDSHESATQGLRAGLDSSAGIAVVTGPAGTGKTLVGVRFLESLPTDTIRVMVSGAPSARPIDFLQALLFDLGQPYQGLSAQELRLAVTAELLSSLADGRTAVLLVDEAHNLLPETLEEIRLLGNVETKSAKALFVGLLGLPRLRELLNKPESAPVAQRIGFRSRLDPLSQDDSIRYLRHQIRACGGRPESVFSDEALELLASRAGGVPRLLNTAASLALSMAQSASADTVDAEAVLEALQHLELIPADEPTLRISETLDESDRLTQADAPLRPISIAADEATLPVRPSPTAPAPKGGKSPKAAPHRRKTA